MYAHSRGIASEVIVVIVIMVIAVAGLGTYLAILRGGEQGQAVNLQVTSSAFSEGAPIPQEYTADGINISPPLTIKNILENAESLTIIMVDPDAPGGVFTH